MKQIPWEDVRGLKIIMPKGMNPEFFAEAGQIGRIMREYGVLEVDIGGVGDIYFLSTSTANRKSCSTIILEASTTSLDIWSTFPAQSTVWLRIPMQHIRLTYSQNAYDRDNTSALKSKRKRL